MWNWLKNRMGGTEHDRGELDDEMRFHLESLVEDLVAQGMDRSEARREALRRFGNPEAVQERVREERGLRWFDETGRNLRFAFRQLVRDPVFGLTYVLTTALIVGLGALAWAVADTTLWRGLPYPNADRLVHVSMYDASSGSVPGAIGVDGSTWEQLRDAGPEWPMAVYSGWGTGVNLSTDGGAAYVQQQRVGASYFETLGVEPARGREFSVAEDVPEGPALAVLSHDLWSATFGGDPDILGTTVRLKGEPHTVIGIMPEDFRSPAEADIWTPLRPDPRGEGSGTNYTIVARVPDGVSLEQSANALRGLAPAFDWAEREGDWRFGLTRMDEADAQQRSATIRILIGGIGLMLLVGWANLAGLQVARTLRRAGELATRRALGGGVGALVRQFATEMVVTGAIAGAIGIGALLSVAPMVESALSTRFGTWQPFPERGVMVAVAIGFTLISIVISGIWPVARTAGRGAASLRVSGTRVRGGRHIGRKVLLVGQLAAVTVLVFSAGLLARSYAHLDGLDAGFNPTGIHVATFSLDDARWSEADSAQSLFSSTVEALEARPEVRSAAVALTLPYERPLNMPIRRPGLEGNLLTNMVYVTPGFFQMLEVPVLRGRALTESDGPTEELALVANQAFVDQYLDDTEAIGARIQIGNGMGEGAIVGVVGNVQQASGGWGNAESPVWQSPTLYLATRQVPAGFMQAVHVWFSPTWLVRGAGADAPLSGVVTEVFRSIAPGLPTARSTTLSSVVDLAFARQRLEAGFLLLMATFAMVLAGLGLWGLVAQEVVERKGEMGVRMALGASPSEAVLKTGVGGLWLAGVGLAIGIALSLPAARLLESLVFGVGAWDPATLAIVVGALGALAVVASFVPAMRIGRLDPARILRSEG
jgi:predicted permease